MRNDLTRAVEESFKKQLAERYANYRRELKAEITTRLREANLYCEPCGRHPTFTVVDKSTIDINRFRLSGSSNIDMGEIRMALQSECTHLGDQTNTILDAARKAAQRKWKN